MTELWMALLFPPALVLFGFVVCYWLERFLGYRQRIEQMDAAAARIKEAGRK